MQLSVISIPCILATTICASPLWSKDISLPITQAHSASPNPNPSQSQSDEVIDIKTRDEWDSATLANFPRQAVDPSQISVLWEEYSSKTRIAGKLLPGNDVYPLNLLNNGKQVKLRGKPLVTSQYVIKGLSNRVEQKDVLTEMAILFDKQMLVAWADTETRNWIKPRYLIVIKCDNCVAALVPLAEGIPSNHLEHIRSVANMKISFSYKFNV